MGTIDDKRYRHRCVDINRSGQCWLWLCKSWATRNLSQGFRIRWMDELYYDEEIVNDKERFNELNFIDLYLLLTVMFCTNFIVLVNLHRLFSSYIVIYNAYVLN